MTWLIRLYPSAWRERYGGELEQLVHDMRPSRSTVGLAFDLVKGAFLAHLQQRFEMRTADRRAIKRGALIAGIIWLGLSVEIVFTNVVFPSTTDDDAIPVLTSYACVFAALFLTGVLAGRDGARRSRQLLAGLVAGVMIAVLTVATFAVVDNVWLDIVGQQQTKIDGFAQSGAPSMREYVNNGLIGVAIFLTLLLALFGPALAAMGGAVGRGLSSPPANADE